MNIEERDLSEQTTILRRIVPREREKESEKAYRREHELLLSKASTSHPALDTSNAKKNASIQPLSQGIQELGVWIRINENDGEIRLRDNY